MSKNVGCLLHKEKDTNTKRVKTYTPHHHQNGTMEPNILSGGDAGSMLSTASLKRIAQFIAIVGMFVIEAIIHYNIGRDGRISMKKLPSGGEWLRIIGVVMFFGALSIAVGELLSALFTTYTTTSVQE